MGLDMYLYEKEYIVKEERERMGLPDKARFITNQVAYWRKANHIHQWFVDHVQKGVDDCGTYTVTRDDLKLLLKTINAILDADDKEALAKIHLPTQEGFFFGGTEYDDYYWADLKDTKVQINRVLMEGGDTFEYHSSW